MAAAVQLGVRGIKARGMLERWNLDSDKVERHETYSCRHCQSPLVKSDQALAVGGKKFGGYCPHCNSVLCAECEKKRLSAASSREACVPFAEVIEASIRRNALHRACGL